MTDISYEGLPLVHRDIAPPLNAEPVILSRHVDTKPTHRALAVRYSNHDRQLTFRLGVE